MLRTWYLCLACSLATSVARAQALPSWTNPVTPFRIVGDVYYVGTEGLAAYLVKSPQGSILLDGTLEQNAPLIERNLAALGVALHTVKLLISDHAHWDHVGAIAQLKKDTGAPFAASAGDRWSLEHGVPPGQVTYTPRPFPPVTVDRVVQDNETIHAGSIDITAHLTPGHTPGCTSWSTTVRENDRPVRVLFLCSITVAGNVLIDNKVYPGIADDYAATFKKLGAMKADVVLTSHPDVEVADVLGREARRQPGQPNPFIDSTALPTVVAQAREHFETALEPELTAARALVHAVPGDLPIAIGYLNVAEDTWKISDAVENGPPKTVAGPTPVFQVRFPHGWIMVDAAMDREVAAGANDTSAFRDDRYARVVAALRGAGLIVITHEHYDHIGTVAHSAIADEVAPKTMLTRLQMESLLHNPTVTLHTPFDTTRAGRYMVVDYDRELPIAPGVVLIKAPGHTPGSQVVYVKLASGREVILSGDIAWHRTSIETGQEKPDSASKAMAEDRTAIAGELAWLRQAQRAGVTVVVSHDGEQLTTLAHQGILSEGLVVR